MKYVRSGLSSDRSYFANLRNYFNRALILEKRAYFSTQINSVRDDSRRLWQQFRNWGMGGNRASAVLLPNHLQDSILINDHFASSFVSSSQSSVSLAILVPSTSVDSEFILQLPNVRKLNETKCHGRGWDRGKKLIFSPIKAEN